MFGLPTTQIENILHNIFLSLMGGLVVHGYFSSGQLETIVSALSIVLVFGLNYFTHTKALAETPPSSAPPVPAKVTK